MIFTRFALFPVLPMILLIVLLLVAAGFIVWQEARRKHRFHTLRILAAIVFMLMLAAYVPKPVIIVPTTAAVWQRAMPRC